MSTQSRSGSGYSAWRLIAEELRREVLDGALPPGTKLSTEGELAERFGVHRHTVRQAVAALVADHLVVSRRGSGSFVADHAVIVHRIGLRTRLSDSLGRRGTAAPGQLLESAVVTDVPADVAGRLQLEGRPALRMESLRTVDGLPVSRGTHWFDAARVGDLAERFAELGSLTRALQAVGIPDYVRASTTVGARHATAAEAADLASTPGTVVLVVQSLDTLLDGTPLQAGLTRFRADRVELDVEHASSGTQGP